MLQYAHYTSYTMTLRKLFWRFVFTKLAVALGVFYLLALLPFAWSSLTRQTLNRGRTKATMVFLMMPMYKTERSVTDAVWQSVYPLLQSGKLDPVFQKKADADKTKTFAEIKDYYHKGYATDIEMIGIEDGIVESLEAMKQHPVNMITMDTKYSPINQARKAFVTYSNVKILKAKPQHTI